MDKYKGMKEVAEDKQAVWMATADEIDGFFGHDNISYARGDVSGEPMGTALECSYKQTVDAIVDLEKFEKHLRRIKSIMNDPKMEGVFQPNTVKAFDMNKINANPEFKAAHEAYIQQRIQEANFAKE